jgi:hypothetical protein
MLGMVCEECFSNLWPPSHDSGRTSANICLVGADQVNETFLNGSDLGIGQEELAQLGDASGALIAGLTIGDGKDGQKGDKELHGDVLQVEVGNEQHKANAFYTLR